MADEFFSSILVNMNPKVDAYLTRATNWHDELRHLRALLLDCGLLEDLKWGAPCYMFQGSNLILFHGFKEYCALTFFNGALLQDPNKILIRPGENTQAGRQLRFKSLKEIIDLEPVIKAYIFESMEVEKAGLKVAPIKYEEIVICEELTNTLANLPAFKTAFEALTPGRQRAYNMFFSDPKQGKTREARIEKFTPRILNGKGMNDCVCGLSKKMPGCDGSHKFAK